MDTICALSSGGLPSGVAVVRLSGPASRAVVEALAGPLPPPRRAALRSIRNRNGEVLDRGLVLWMPGPESFTGEDTAEFHLHGSRAVVSAVLEACREVSGVRPAAAGEFTRRALLSGKIDLTEAEGLADLLAAETEAQRRQAVAQASGSLRALYEGWRRRLVRIRALIEADFDFAEEEDVPGSVADAAWADATALLDEFRAHLDDGRRGERLRSGFRVVLLGPPNAGKSSLLNALAQREAAIVTEEAGTTRDPIEVHLDLAGVPVTVVDTAGLREATGRVEAEGIRRAREQGRTADLCLWLRGPGDDGVTANADLFSVPDGGADLWVVATKADLDVERRGVRFDSATKAFGVSVVTGEGLAGLVTALGEAAAASCGRGSEVVASRARHRGHVTAASSSLEQAIMERSKPVELRAEDLRRAADEIGRITGSIGVEDLLDVIFKEFCVGK